MIHNLTVPGDVDSGITSFTGLYSRFYLPGGGTILMDAGTFSQDIDGIVREGGPHPFNDYFVNGDTARSRRSATRYLTAAAPPHLVTRSRVRSAGPGFVASDGTNRSRRPP